MSIFPVNVRRRPRRAQSTLGYPTIEGLLDSEDCSQIYYSHFSIERQTEQILQARHRTDLDRDRARRVLAASELALELLQELLEIKAQLPQKLPRFWPPDGGSGPTSAMPVEVRVSAQLLKPRRVEPPLQWIC